MTEQKQPKARIALYARVSTTNHHQDPDVQLREMHAYLGSSWTIVGEYVDRVSTRKASRPERQRLLADAASGKFDAVCVWKLDRWGRSLKDIVNTLAELEEHHVSFISQRDQIDLTTPAGRFMRTVLIGVAEFERDIISERVCAGLRNAKAQGKQLGHPSATPITPQLVKRVKDLKQKGQSLRDIAEQVKVSHVTVSRLVKS